MSAIQLVFETHATTVDNEQDRATGWRPGRLSARVIVVGHVVTLLVMEFIQIFGVPQRARVGRECR